MPAKQTMKPKTAFEIRGGGAQLRTGCPAIDTCLRGGFRVGGITEISGESSSGKTQLCLQLSIQCQRSILEGGLEGGTLYVFCEGTFPVARLEEMAGGNRSLLDHIFVEHADSAEELWTVISSPKLHSALAKGIIKLVVIDSLTSIIRGEFSSSRQDLSDRADTLFAFAGRMKRLASLYDCLFLVINQVSGVFEKYPAPAGMADSFLPNGHELNQTALIPPLKVSPSLGIVWSTCVNTRVMLHRIEDPSRAQVVTRALKTNVITFAPVLRELRILLSSRLPTSSCRFIVTRKGLVDE